MGILYAFEMMTLDGFFEGPDHDIRWHKVDAEFNAFSARQLAATAALLFGRATYQLMAGYWPTATGDDPVIPYMNSLPKIVFSRTLESAEWKGTRLIRENAVEEVQRLKVEIRKDLAIFGSANLLSALSQAGLVDEYRIMVNPVILGRGTPLFQGVERKIDLKLISSNTYRSGNVLLCYRESANANASRSTDAG
jgi:dihydrofolate reductase